MAKTPTESAGSEQPPASEEPVQSIEDDGKGEDSQEPPEGGDEVRNEEATGDVTEDQWRAMMDVVMAIYNYREDECASSLCRSVGRDIADPVARAVAMIPRDFSSAASISAMFLIIMISSRSLWL